MSITWGYVVIVVFTTIFSGLPLPAVLVEPVESAALPPPPPPPQAERIAALIAVKMKVLILVLIADILFPFLLIGYSAFY